MKILISIYAGENGIRKIIVDNKNKIAKLLLRLANIYYLDGRLEEMLDQFH